MKLLRWSMGALLALWTLRGVVALVQTTLGKAGAVPMDKVPAEYLPFVEAVTPIQLALWAISFAAYAVVVVRYFTRQRAFSVFAFAFVVEIILFATFWPMPSYQALASERNMDLVGFALLLVIAIVTWWSESGRANEFNAR